MSSKDQMMTARYDDEEMEIDLKDLFLTLLDHWWQILLSTILAGAIFFAYTFFMITPLYTSTSILYVLSASTTISVSDIQIGNYLTNDYIEVISGRPVLDQVIENLGLDLTYSELYAKVSLTNPDDSRLLEITVTDEDPEMAKLITDEIAEVASLYIEQKMDQDAPSIIQYGYVATKASSPSIKKNTVIGALIGAILSIGIICLTYLLNDTILSPEDLEKRVGLNVLASLPREHSEGDSYDDDKKRGKRRKSA